MGTVWARTSHALARSRPWPLAVLLLVVVAADWFARTVPTTALARALCDSAGHGAIAAAGWLAVALPRPLLPPLWRPGVAVALVAATACALDADHFAAAWSVTLADATSLPRRPPGHSLLFALACVATAAYVCRHRACAGMVAQAVLSHQLRDSIRRGLFLWPLPDTPPVPYLPYLLAQCVLPRLVYAYCHPPPSSPRVTPGDELV